MKVLLCDNADYNQFFVLDVCAAYYDEDIAGLVLTPSYGSFDDFCFPDMEYSCCNGIVLQLFEDGISDLRAFGEVQLYSDCTKEE